MSSQSGNQTPDKDLADLLSEDTPFTDETIEVNIGEIAKTVIETLSNVKGIESIKDVHEKEAELKGKYINNIEIKSEEKFLEVFITLVELFSEEEEEEESGGSMNDLIGFGEDPKEDAVKNALEYSNIATEKALQIGQGEKRKIKKQIEEFREDKKELAKKLESGKKDKNLNEFIKSLRKRLE